MTVTLTCPECGSGVHVAPSCEATFVHCEICSHNLAVSFNEDHEKGLIQDCPCCGRKDFYKQKDFNRKIGVIFFIIAAILSLWTYGISFIVLYLFDFFLFKKLKDIVICYKCQAIFRGAVNVKDIHGFDHEMNDRILYSDHDFGGKAPQH